MPEYTKPWLSISEQLDKLESRGVGVFDREAADRLLSAVGYYRITGYLYPLRSSSYGVDEAGARALLVEDTYRPGTTIEYAAALVDFDRSLRMLVLDGIERIEISLRTQVAHRLGRRSAFAHFDPSNFVDSFTGRTTSSSAQVVISKHTEWIERVRERAADSDETFVSHFHRKYDGGLPIWVLTEILELGHLGRLYRGLNSSIATEVASSYGVPTKKMMSSWISCLNYVRNLSAHHARLFNRKLVNAPARPTPEQIRVLGHLREQNSAKQTFGIYNALAVMAYLLSVVEVESGWAQRMVDLAATFPASEHLSLASMGFPVDWAERELWRMR